MEEDFLQVVDRLSKVEKLAEGHRMLQEAIQGLGLSHVAYFAVNLPGDRADRMLVSVTYAPDWQRQYLQNGYVNIDPVVRAGLAGVLPVDWSEIDRNDRMVRRFFGEAQEFSVGKNGLSIPIRGRHHEFALFSVTSDARDAEWQATKPRLMRELMLLSYHFHDWTLQASGLKVKTNPLEKLSTREKDCLRWRALGKSDWDISQVLAISERTVKFHLENARSKLGASNTTHAVTRALTFGLVAAV
jgi:DNA-binding CsgD family transcriptional regulator